MYRRLYAAAALAFVVASIGAIETWPVAHGARTLEFGLVLVLFAVFAWASNGRLRDAFLVLCSLIFGIGALEAVSPLLLGNRAPQRSAVKEDGGVAGPKPLVGWGPQRPGVFASIKTAADGTPIWTTHVTIDDSLNRKTIPAGPRPIAFFGDSWTYGDGVDDDGTVTQAFADLNQRKIPVLNLSFAGWSPAQNLVALQQGLYKTLLDRPRHFFLFTATFHVERTACKRDFAISQAPRFVPDGDGVRYAGACGDAHNFFVAPLVRLARGSALYDRIAAPFATLSGADVETYIRIIEAFVATAKADYGVKTTVLYAPFDDRYIRGTGYDDDRILAALRKAGVDVLVDELPPVPDMRVYWIPNDGHPTALANKERAKLIERHLREVDPAALEVEAPEATR